MAVSHQAKVPVAGPLITLLTDFGERDYFVASMKGVILSIHPDARIVDLSHQIAPHQIEEAAYVLRSCYHYFPEGTVHVAIVDPGVGTVRRPLLASSSKYHFLAPDNGLLTRVLRNEQDVTIRQVDYAAYRRDAEGATFDGRDLFAPAAAWLAKGKPVASFGQVIDDPVTLPLHEPKWQGDALVGRIEYVDRFGNLISNVTPRHLQELKRLAGRESLTIRIAGRMVEGLVASYSEGIGDMPAALINSGGKLEVFLSKKSAAAQLSLGVGAEIKVG